MMRCQDCGNQAKKDCFYYRCRTCCKSRGFECQTHIKSTWVPVSTRDRVRPHPQPHDLLLTGHHHHQHQQHLLSSVSTTTIPHQQHLSNPCKKISIPLFCTFREGNLPAEVSCPATFRCLRVSSSDDNAVDQYAYQTSVNIGGHVFKGILYDQGPAADHNNLYNMGIMTGEGETSTGGLELQPNLNITTYSSFPFLLASYPK